MKNELYKYSDLEGTHTYKRTSGVYEKTTYVYKDYTSVDYSDIFKWDEVKSDAWTYIYLLDDNVKIETVSFELYGTPDYWDLLLGINNRNPIFEMPYDIVEDELAYELEKFKTYSADSTELLEIVETKLRESIETKNDTLKELRVIRPERLQDFLRLMRSRGLTI